jgi:hypothetical protein
VIDLTEIGAAKIEYEATFHNTKHTYAYGSHVAHVAVDPRVGHIQIVDYVAVEDAGRIINPLTLHGQSIGAIVQGLGGTLLEHLVYDNGGQMLTGSLADSRLGCGRRRITHLAPKAQAKVAQSRWAGSLRTPWRTRSPSCKWNRASFRYRRRNCGV